MELLAALLRPLMSLPDGRPFVPENQQTAFPRSMKGLYGWVLRSEVGSEGDWKAEHTILEEEHNLFR